MNYFLAISCVLCGWAMLRLMGSERAQLVKNLERQLRREAKLSPPVPQPPAAENSPAKPAPAAKARN